MIHHVAIFLALITQGITGPYEGLHSSKLNSANRQKIQKTAHKGICFARLRQIQLQQLLRAESIVSVKSLPAVVVLYFTASEKEICVQKVISYKGQKLSQCTGKQNYVIKSEENSDYYYLSNRKMIEVVFSSRVSLLAFYFQESFTAHKMVL